MDSSAVRIWPTHNRTQENNFSDGTNLITEYNLSDIVRSTTSGMRGTNNSYVISTNEDLYENGSFNPNSVLDFVLYGYKFSVQLNKIDSTPGSTSATNDGLIQFFTDGSNLIATIAPNKSSTKSFSYLSQVGGEESIESVNLLEIIESRGNRIINGSIPDSSRSRLNFNEIGVNENSVPLSTSQNLILSENNKLQVGPSITSNEANSISNVKFIGIDENGTSIYPNIGISASNGLKFENNSITLSIATSAEVSGATFGTVKVSNSNGLSIGGASTADAGIVKINQASSSSYGTVKINTSDGLTLNGGMVGTKKASSSDFGTIKINNSGTGLTIDEGIIGTTVATSTSNGVMTNKMFDSLNSIVGETLATVSYESGTGTLTITALSVPTIS